MERKGFGVELTLQAEKDLRDLRPWIEPAASEIARLEDEPYLGHPLTGSLRGCRSLEFNLRGGGAYRAVYLVLENERVCLVFLVGAHEGLYAMAERRRRALRPR